MWCDLKKFLSSMTNHHEVRKIRIFLPLKTFRVIKVNQTQDSIHNCELFTTTPEP